MAEDRFGRKVVSPEDFVALSDDVRNVTRQSVSVSTIKRLWGYVSSTHVPRNSILSAFAQYIGYRDWDAFVTEADATLLPDSGYLDADTCVAQSLALGDRVMLTWNPGRKIIAECIGECRFRVIENVNSKLNPGAEFTCMMFSKGNPLITVNVDVPGEEKPHKSYIAAGKSGLSGVEIIKTRQGE